MERKRGIAIQDHRKQQLIDATLHVISEHGLAKTSIAKVTRAAGLSIGIVNYYFRSREQLLTSTLEYVSAEYEMVMATVFESSKNPLTVLKNFIYASFSPPIFVFEKIAVWHSFTANPKARMTYYETVGGLEDRIRQKLSEQIDILIAKDQLTHINSDSIALSIDQVVDYQWFDYLQNKMDFNHREAEKTSINLITALFSGSYEHNQITLKSFIDQIGPDQKSEILPRWTYHNDEFLNLEKKIIFNSNWLVVGHVNEIPHIGDYLTFDAPDKRLVVIRGKDSQIRAMENACQHMGTRLLDGKSGRCKSNLTCPFHEWVYGLDGALLKTPDIDAFKNIDREKIRLSKLDLEIWNGFIFIRTGSGVPAVNEILAGVDHLFEPYYLDTNIQIEKSNSETLLPFNWKVFQEADYEFDHIPAHTSPFHALFGGSSNTEILGHIPVWSASIQASKTTSPWSIRHYQSLLPQFTHLPENFQRTCYQVGAFPYLSFILYPECVKYVMTLPETTHLTRVINGIYFFPDQRRETQICQFLSRRIDKSLKTLRKHHSEQLQQGLSSNLPSNRILEISGSNTKFFHNSIQNRLPVSMLLQEPGPGTVSDVNDLLGEKWKE